MQTPLEWLNAYPRGMEEILLYVMKIYHKPMIVTENGKLCLFTVVFLHARAYTMGKRVAVGKHVQPKNPLLRSKPI